MRWLVLVLPALSIALTFWYLGVEWGRRKGEEIGRLKLAVQLGDLMRAGHLQMVYDTDRSGSAVAEKVGDVFVVEARVTH